LILKLIFTHTFDSLKINYCQLRTKHTLKQCLTITTMTLQKFQQYTIFKAKNNENKLTEQVAPMPQDHDQPIVESPS